MNRSTWIKRNLAKQFRETKRVAVAEFMRREYLPMETGNDVGRERKTSALWSRAVTGTIDAIRRVTRISFAFPVTETPVAQSVNWLRSVSPFLRRCFTKLSSVGRLFPDSVPGDNKYWRNDEERYGKLGEYTWTSQTTEYKANVGKNLIVGNAKENNSGRNLKDPF